MLVTARLKFLTPCLGNKRMERRDLMLRDSSGKVLLLQSWWRAGLYYAAQALSRYQKEVGEIQADPVVEGSTTIYRRYYSDTCFKEHEAFDAGSEVTVNFCVPDRISLAAFRELMDIAGKYVGISPYGYKADFGRFVVLEIKPLKRGTHERGRDTAVGESDTGSASACRHPDTGIDVRQTDSKQGQQS
jgi:hypothetical protein